MQDEKIILIVKAYPNWEKNKPEFYWEFPDNCSSSRMIGILELIKMDIINNWLEKSEVDS